MFLETAFLTVRLVSKLSVGKFFSLALVTPLLEYLGKSTKYFYRVRHGIPICLLLTYLLTCLLT